jgi:hypothetical protein
MPANPAITTAALVARCVCLGATAVCCVESCWVGRHQRNFFFGLVRKDRLG